jgi:RNA polymerase sigma factor (sigma-70 family)
MDEGVFAAPAPAHDVVALDEALAELAAEDPRKAQVVELHFFAGLKYDEIAEAAGISEATVHRDLRLAKAWLRRQMEHRPRGR